MTNEEQKAWDTFAAAALSGYFAQQYTPHLNAHSKDAVEYICETADAMMEQRKARM